MNTSVRHKLSIFLWRLLLLAGMVFMQFNAICLGALAAYGPAVLSAVVSLVLALLFARDLVRK